MHGQLELCFPAPVAYVMSTPHPAHSEATPKAGEHTAQTRKTAPSSLLALHTVPSPENRPQTLDACLAHVEAAEELSPKQIHRMRASVRQFGRLLQRGGPLVPAQAMTELPADPALLRPLLDSIQPGLHPVAHATWANTRSMISGLLRASGWVLPDARLGAPLTGEWVTVIEVARAHNRLHPIPPFARYCQSVGLRPQDVVPATLENYEAFLSQKTTNRCPRAAAVAVKGAWNRIAPFVPGTPLSRLHLKSKVNWKASRIGEFHPEFAADLNEYLESLRRPDRLNPRHGRPCAEITVQHARRAILRASTYIVGTGMPIAELRRLDQLVSPTAMRTVLEQLDQEYGDADGQGGWSKTAVMISTALVNLARRWASLSPQELTEVEELHRLVKAPRGGLSRRNRDKLAQFSSNGDRAELYELPDRALAEAQQRLRNAKSKDRGIMAAKMHETALALKILLTQPLRSGDLERIDIVEHLQRDRRGRLHRLAIRTHKTRREVDVLLPPDLVAAIERHITTFRPLLPGADKGSALFPGPSGLHRARGSIGRHIRRLVMRQLGALFTPHLARHLSAEIILDHDPNGLPIVQRLLGHGTLSRTQEMYGVTRTSAAQKSYTALVEDLRGKAHAKQASAKPRQPRSRREAL